MTVNDLPRFQRLETSCPRAGPREGEGRGAEGGAEDQDRATGRFETSICTYELPFLHSCLPEVVHCNSIFFVNGNGFNVFLIYLCNWSSAPVDSVAHVCNELLK